MNDVLYRPMTLHQHDRLAVTSLFRSALEPHKRCGGCALMMHNGVTGCCPSFADRRTTDTACADHTD